VLDRCQPCRRRRVSFLPCVYVPYLMIASLMEPSQTTLHSHSWILPCKCHQVTLYLRSIFCIPHHICSGQEGWKFRQSYLCNHQISLVEIPTLAFGTGLLSVVVVHLSQFFGIWFPRGHQRMVFLRQGHILEAMGK
jgi:hypothetical protein